MKRLEWLDFLKFVAMLAVIVGHTVFRSGTETEQLVRGLIYSVHMPLLFFLAGVTFKPSRTVQDFLTKVKKSAGQLILPIIVILVIRAILSVLLGEVEVSLLKFVFQRIIAFLFTSGIRVHLFGRTIQPAGMVWFLMVLFWARLLLDLLYQFFSEKVVGLLMLLSLLSGYFISTIIWLPFSLDIVLVVLPLLYIAHYLSRKGKFNQSRKLALVYGLIFFTVWLLGVLYLYGELTDGLYLELAVRSYPLPYLSFPLALFGSLGFCYLSLVSANLPLLAKVSKLGQYNLYLFFIHAFDTHFQFLWELTSSALLNGIIRAVVDVLILLIVIQLKKKFQRNQ